MAATDETRPDERHAGAQKVFFLCRTQPARGVTQEQLYPHLPEHKKWVAEQEDQGRIFVAGPLLDEDYRAFGTGVLVIRARSLAEARDIFDSEPYHARGLRTYRLWPWQINEGSFHLRASLSGGTLRIG
ncbi:hypothetical protein GCM10018793_47090 [Streptomyces sulfonofaciens]|uniref:YCII-related domain-containing protein n=1 Tax=Streptomyces sulfonofaciens TaxID=68272 RepID=A0A919L4V4_9ACTN|nr:YciI family protein [Streptomyces sulfonofaciens]GHH83892.1 hypothetical protein GCM10018793_47090 [Streptomyces sulfonofaciens]